MSDDLPSRLRAGSALSWISGGRATLREAADEIDRLRETIRSLANHGAAPAANPQRYTATRQSERGAGETLVALTDAEREAIREAVGAYNDNDDDEECAKIAATLYRLLKRTK